MSRYTKTLIALGGLGLLAFLLATEGWTMLLPVEFAHAQRPANDLANSGMMQAIMQLESYALTFMNFCTWFAFMLVSRLLDPNYIFGMNTTTGTSMLDILNGMWKFSRNIMNILFAIMLIVAAIYTVVMAKKDFIADRAGKFVLAVVLVNFSWLAPQMFLDFANVLTVAIYQIPSLADLPGGASQCRVQQPINQPNYNCVESAGVDPKYYTCDCKIVVNAEVFVDGPRLAALKTAQNAQNGWTCPLDNLICVQYVPFGALPNTSNMTKVMNGLFVNHSRLTALSAVPAPINGAQASQAIAFVIRQAFILIFQVMLGFALLAMAIAFIIRIPILWMTMAFMPFYFLKFIPGLEKFMEGVNPEDILKSFMKAALLPAMVAIPLSVGYVMINTAMTIAPTELNLNIPLLDGINNLWQLLWLCITLGVIWIGVFTALRSGGKLIEGITSKIKGAGEGYGKFLAKLPLNAPIFPTPKGGANTSASQFLRPFSARNLNAASDQGQLGKVLTKDKNSGNEAIGGRLRTSFAEQGEVRKLVKEIRTGAVGEAKTQKAVQDLIDKLNSMSGGRNHVNKDNLSEVIKKLQKDNPNVLDDVKPADIDDIDRKAKNTPAGGPPTPPPAPPNPPAPPTP